MEYKLTSEAKSDLNRIWTYGKEKFGERQADKYFYELMNQFQLIANNPLQFPSIDNTRKNYRRSVCGSDVIYFKLHSNYVEISAIIGSQDIEELLL